MDVILWRHAEAEDGGADLARALTGKGEKQARRVAEWLHRRLPDSARILASPAKRAQQTAHALAEASHRKVKTVDALAPGATAKDALTAIGWGSGKGVVVVVGHQPTLGEVVSQLLEHADADWPIKKGGLVWLTQRESDGEARPTVRAAISPDLV
jgi:phosphohistidine phosphatase